MSESQSVRPKQPKKPPRDRTNPVKFYRQVVAEMRKVVWPSQPQLVTYFIVVMVFCLVLIGLVSLYDLAFGKLVFAVFG